MSETHPKNGAFIARYLLGDASEDQLEEIEALYVQDPDFMIEVEIVEDRLIRDYLDGLLTVRDSELFERKYYRVPELRDKVAYVRRLRTVSKHYRVPKWPGAAWLGHPLPTIFAAVGLVALCCGGWWLVRESHRSPHDVATGIESRVPAPATEVEVADTALTSGIFSAIVLPGLPKVIGPPPRRFILTEAVKEVRLQLELPGVRDSFTARADLLLVREADRKLVWTRGGIPVTHTLAGASLLISLEPAELPSGDYWLEVKREATAGTLRSYVFSVGRR